MPRPVLAIGGATVDRTYLCANEPSPGTSNPVTSRRNFGGVARNVADSLARLGASIGLISAVGADDAGRALSAGLTACGVDVRGLLTVTDQPTAEYTAAFWRGELFAGFADMTIFEALTPQAVTGRLPENLGEWLVFADCNLPQATLTMLTARAQNDGFRLALDAVSLAKSERLPASLSGVAVVFLNQDQARHLGGLDALLARGARAVVLTQGKDGVTIAEGARRTHLPPPAVVVVSVSGAGDAMISGALLALSQDRPLTQAVRYGLAAASLALQTLATVPADLSRARLEAALAQLPASPGPYHAE